jgi:hypothetical protein
MSVAKLDIPFLQARAACKTLGGDRLSTLALQPKIGLLCMGITFTNSLGFDAGNISEPEVT